MPDIGLTARPIAQHWVNTAASNSGTGEIGAGILEVGKILERPDAVELTRRR